MRYREPQRHMRIADHRNAYGGEAVQFTKVETGVNSFQWSPDGKSIAFTAAPSKKDLTKNRKEHLGDFEVVRMEYDYQHLWTIDVAEAFKGPQAGKQRSKGEDFSVGRFSWSPDCRSTSAR